jgi:hypothetical protein
MAKAEKGKGHLSKEEEEMFERARRRDAYLEKVDKLITDYGEPVRGNPADNTRAFKTREISAKGKKDNYRFRVRAEYDALGIQTTETFVTFMKEGKKRHIRIDREDKHLPSLEMLGVA